MDICIQSLLRAQWGIPFSFQNLVQSSLSMDGREYEGLNLRYDLYRDQVLFNHIHRSGSYIVVLNKNPDRRICD